VEGIGNNGSVEELHESEERYRIVTEISRDGIEVVNETGEYVFVNPAVEEMLGYSPDEMLGKQYRDFLDIVHPDDRNQVSEGFSEVELREGSTLHYAPMRCRHKDGHWVWIKAIATSFINAKGERCILEVTQDITAQKQEEERKRKLAEQMKESQRLEGLGVLAGGIAHDFNNLLTPMLGDASLALLDLPGNSPARLRLHRIQKAAHRAAALTSQMLSYSGKNTSTVEPLDLSQLVRQMAELLQGAVSGKAQLTCDLADDLPAVEADATQISQVVMNLVTNAAEAVREGAGQMTLRTGLVTVEKVQQGFLVANDKSHSKAYVFIEVVDNGCGMDEQTQARIFDPFFTTKFSGRGLGLAAALGIVHNHGGAIEIDSEVDRGTRFRVLLPSIGRMLFSAPAEEIPIEDWRGQGTVLVVDDDDGVRDLVGEVLRRAGMTVLLASDGLEALKLYRVKSNEIDVVVLDRSMPNISGEKAFDEIRRIRPDAHVILVSGYSEESAAWHFLDRGLDAFLHKPFEPMELIRRVRRILESV
jgi:PAS domain S-box-containing protein